MAVSAVLLFNDDSALAVSLSPASVVMTPLTIALFRSFKGSKEDYHGRFENECTNFRGPEQTFFFRSDLAFEL